MTAFRPTHTVVLDSGKRIPVCVPEDGESPAYTRAEWSACDTADYARDGGGRWTFQGQTFNGRVVAVPHRPRRDPAAARVSRTYTLHPSTVARIDATAKAAGESAGQVVDRLAKSLGQ